MHNITGNCSKCGAPFFAPNSSHSIIPPALVPSCNCWNVNKIKTSISSSEIVFNDR